MGERVAKRGTHTNGAHKGDGAEQCYPNIEWPEVEWPAVGSVPVCVDSSHHEYQQCGLPPLPIVDSPRTRWIGSWTGESMEIEPIELNVNRANNPSRESWCEFRKREARWREWWDYG